MGGWSSGVPTTLDALTDVATAGALDADVLTYNAGTNSWVPAAAAGGGGGGAPTTAPYLTSTSVASLSAEVVFGTSVMYAPGTLAAMPAASATIVGALYPATDASGSAGQGALYRSDGSSAWTRIAVDKGWTDVLYAGISHTHAASDIVSGTIATARLGSGTANAGSVLSGDQTYKQIADAQVASGAAIAVSKIAGLGAAALLADPITIAHGGTGQTAQAAGFDALSPNTTRGDISYMGASNNVRLAKGTSGMFLKIGANDPAWANIAESDVTNLVSDLALKAPFASPALTGSPTAPTQSAFDGSTKLATTAYVDNAITALDTKPDVAYASTSALPANTYNNGTAGVGATLTGNANGPLIIDSVTILVAQAGERVLVAGEATAANNGWYTITQVGVVAVSPYILTRAGESDQAAEIGAGYLTGVVAPNTVTPGTANNGKLYISVAADPFTVGTTSLTFSQVGSTYAAGTGLTLSGQTFSITNTAVGAASYGDGQNVATFTVNAQGQLTAAAAVAIASLNASVITAGTIATARLGSGSATSSTFLRGDQTWATPSGSGSVATDAIWDTKGDLAVATGADTAAKLAAGANNLPLVADSAQTTGLKWAALTVPGGGTGATTLTNHGVLLGQTTSAIVATAAGTAGQFLKSGGSSADPAFAATVDRQVFTTGSGNWTKPGNAQRVHVICIGGGGQGGSGRCGASASASGGGGGSAGSIAEGWFDAADLAGTVAYAVGAGGTGGGTAVGTAASDGVNGGAGNASTFGIMSAAGGNFGAGGTNSTGTAGTLVNGEPWTGAAGGAGATIVGSSAATAAGSGLAAYSAGGGGGGGGGNASFTTQTGGSGGAGNPNAWTAATTGGQTQAAAGANGVAGSIIGGLKTASGGAGGAGGNNAGGGNGGTGAQPGGGGGGGGGCVNGGAGHSGTGAAGGDGIVIVTSYL